MGETSNVPQCSCTRPRRIARALFWRLTAKVDPERCCALESLAGPAFFIDSRGDVLCANAAAVAALRAERDRLIGTPFLNWVLGEDRERSEAELQRCRSVRDSLSWPLRAVAADGSAIGSFALAHAAQEGHCADVVLELRTASPEREVQATRRPASSAPPHLRDAPNSMERVSERCAQCREAMNWDMTLAEDRERQRIAADLHDHVGQGLVSAQLKLGMLGETLPADLAARVEEVRTLLRETLEATRSLTFRAGNPLLRHLGLEAGLEALAQRLELDHGLRATVTAAEGIARLPQRVELVLYRVVSELMFNAAKHARADQLNVHIVRNGVRALISVEDNGIGMAQHARSQPPGACGVGLCLAEERLATLGGRMTIDPAHRPGTRILVEIPVPPSDPPPEQRTP